MQIVEIFKSIQGEGTLIGSPMVFIRLWGCNMKCTWCDTAYSWSPEFKDITKRDILNPNELANLLLQKYPEITWFNFTGGEPTLWATEILQTTIILQKQAKKVCIQTNGKDWNDDLFEILDKICMDLKCPNSGEKSDLNLIEKLRIQDELKFVIQTENDLEYTEKIIKDCKTNATIIIQPVMIKNESLDLYYARIRWLVKEFESTNHKEIRILPQLHQLLWRDIAGT
jgi:7-carboxy-7-deazaguanine synthase